MSGPQYHRFNLTAKQCRDVLNALEYAIEKSKDDTVTHADQHWVRWRGTMDILDKQGLRQHAANVASDLEEEEREDER